MKRTARIVGLLALCCLCSCAETSVVYGPFAYKSAKDVSLTKVKWEKRPDGSESFSADQVGGIASTVDQIQAQAISDLAKTAAGLAARVP